MSRSEEFSVGQRCKVGEHFATIRYVGPVPPSEGEWVGVEWDDANRGKHSGDHEGTKYFTCRPGSGSFVRPKKIERGVTFLEALKERYISGGVGDDEEMFVMDKDSNTTKVYMVGAEKIAGKLSQVHKLQKISLRDMMITSAGATPDQIKATLPCLDDLNLSHNLLSAWEEVAVITSGLDTLSSLDISENKLAPPFTPSAQTCAAFSHLKSLYASKMNLEWNEVQFIAATFEAVKELHLCQNHIRSLSKVDGFQHLKLLNLEDNFITEWNVISDSLSALPQLEVLILNGNQLSGVCIKDTNQLSSLRSLSLERNLISEWQSVNALLILHSLRELKLRDNPLVEAFKEQLSIARQLIIARLGGITSLNNSEINPNERKASERYYIKRYAQKWMDSQATEDSKRSFSMEHPRYTQLTEVHGLPDVAVSQQSTGRLTVKDSLLSLTFLCPDDPSQKQVVKKLPGTITVMKLKALLFRLYKVDSTSQKLSYKDSKGQEYELNDDMKDLSFYSVSNGDTILLRW
ncbi:tubulin-specific chaperone E-like [Dysidea avara]|uniref:tubulin-specific chaperone E-like n=1 Tax=Dysidea avara TaxID=196820 RepID=UPI00332F1FBF